MNDWTMVISFALPYKQYIVYDVYMHPCIHEFMHVHQKQLQLRNLLKQIASSRPLEQTGSGTKKC